MARKFSTTFPLPYTCNETHIIYQSLGLTLKAITNDYGSNGDLLDCLNNAYEFELHIDKASYIIYHLGL